MPITNRKRDKIIEHMPKLPCKKLKCLKYPLCIERDVIICHVLFLWIGGNSSMKLWGHMRKYLRNLNMVKANYDELL